MVSRTHPNSKVGTEDNSGLLKETLISWICASPIKQTAYKPVLLVNLGKLQFQETVYDSAVI